MAPGSVPAELGGRGWDGFERGHVQQGEIPAVLWPPAHGVDVDDVAEGRRLAQRGVSDHQRPKAVHTFGLAKLDSATGPHAGVLRQPQLLGGLRRFKRGPQLIPGWEWAVGVHYTDQAAGRHHLDGDRQLTKLGGELALFIPGQAGEPGAAVVDPVVDVAGVEPADVIVMVAAHRVKPWLGQPGEHVAALGPAVDQITDAEQPVNCRIEAGRIQSGLQPAEVPMDVADREIAASHVGGEALDAHHLDVFEHAESSPAHVGGLE